MLGLGFGDKISALVSKEMATALGDADAMAEITERLVNSLAFTIAIAARGDPEGSERFIEGAISHLYEMTTHHAPAGRFFGCLPPKSRLTTERGA